MRILGVVLAVIAAILPIADARADNCQFTFRCQAGICERVSPASCSGIAPAAKVDVIAPPAAAASVVAPAPDAAARSLVLVQPLQSAGNTTAAPLLAPAPAPAPLPAPPPPAGLGCAENGSCYGDLSTINGTPKTTQVDGYFRRDGTYVRGHYRSSGRK